ncbi:kanadaptin isoform X1 [Plutella xylostella]|uniref:kanadaptin isoform X1 n=1 Tax=Plutella xylostella TaxID=51655 RepID=UPI002032547B|nr:kanadaptin isoform X1 [Plutella xylostella]
MEEETQKPEDVSENVDSAPKPEFKKPVLFGRVGKLPQKVKNEAEKAKGVDTKPKEDDKMDKPKERVSAKSSLPPALLLKEMSTPIPYKEPKWSGLCPDGTEYALEVLKSGMILEQVKLTQKPYLVFGRLANCDVVMAHPTISRHHAVVQYKAFAEDGEPPSGWYLYDLGSTHGTFLNKDRVKPQHYTRVRVGHQIKFGTSTRTYVMLGPDFDSEGESELSVTEIKQRSVEMKKERDRMIQEAIEQREKDRLEEERKREEQGIDWGMGEDAEEETDLSENPFAATNNEELYLEDPKKTLRGYYEREGHELVYDCEERGVGQYICRVELPIDDARGRPVMAEVVHKGKKKEAVVACAMEACRILDRAGLLRQAKHESRRRKQRDYSADDYYDSDDDVFLDRTGAVERKRDLRKRKHTQEERKEEVPLTYDGLLQQITEIEQKIAVEEKGLDRLRALGKPKQEEEVEGDSLDNFMSSLGKQGHSMAQKAEISSTKMKIQKLKAELSKTQRLAELARPAHLPPLIKKDDSKMAVKVNNSVVYGKRIRLKEDSDKRPKAKQPTKQKEDEFIEEVDSEEESEPSRSEPEVDSSTQKAEKKEDSKKTEVKRMFGPMRPPEDYVVPEGYFNQESDRDLPEIMDDET